MNVRAFKTSAIAAAALIGGGGFAQAARAAEFANVVSSTPVTASVPVVRQACSDGQQYVQAAPSGAGALIGAIAGGVIGHSVGAGFGRAAATGVGAVTGAVVGNQVEANTNPVTAVPVRSCQNVTSYENRVVGYDVLYEYGGQRYNTRMARDPGRQLAVNVQPADSAPLGVAPQGAYSNATAGAYADGSQPVPVQPAYYDPLPRPVYYSPYYAPAPVYVSPTIGVGFGYYGGGYRRWR